MKTILLYSITLLLTGNGFAQEQQSLQNQPDTVYYYLDCSCFCSPDTSHDFNRYLFISDTVYSASRDSLENEVDKFKAALEVFSEHATISKTVVLRYEATAEGARNARLNKIAEMRSRYTIIEIEYRP